jgi:hypothetical protein
MPVLMHISVQSVTETAPCMPWSLLSHSEGHSSSDPGSAEVAAAGAGAGRWSRSWSRSRSRSRSRQEEGIAAWRYYQSDTGALRGNHIAEEGGEKPEAAIHKASKE